MRCIASIAANGSMKVQGWDQMQHTENKRLVRAVDDETSGSAEFSGIGGGICYDSEMNLYFLIFSCLIFESSVDRGIPSFAAAPSGPATFPLLAANAASIISFS